MEGIRRNGRIRRAPSSGSDTDTSTGAPIRKKSRQQPEDEVKNEAMEQEEQEEDFQEASTSQAANSMTETARNSQHVTTMNLTSELPIPNVFNRCGKVISMRLTNFMCHSNLFIEFGPNINFLVGNNGSGKSAVITALALGLTSSARVTSRASSIQKLIKNGQASATIAITLSNTGLRPFKRDIFGPSITVVRHIRQSSSSYDLQDANRRSVSKKVGDIRRMLLCFGINVENPIFVLNQEAAREFLKELEPKSNYKLVMKATQLDICSSSLQHCHEQRTIFAHEEKELKNKLQFVQKQVEAEQEKLNILLDKEGIEEKLKVSEIKLAWLAVTRSQDELKQMEQSISLIEEKKRKLEETTLQRESTQASLTQQLSHFETTKNVFLNSYKDQEAKVRMAKKASHDHLLKGSSAKAQLDNAQRRMREEQHTYAACEKHIGSYHADFNRVKEQREEHAKQLASLTKQVAESDELIARWREEQQQIKRDLTAIQERADSVRNERSQLHKSKQNMQWEIESLSRNKSNNLSVYGEQAMQVVHVLRTQYAGANLHRMPRGPLGQYISAPNPKYRDLVENQLFTCLRSYIVGSDRERQSLRSLLNNKFPNGNVPTIITSPFTDRVYDVSRHKVRATTPNTTVLIDEISCDDPVVMNYLIDMLRIETVLVTESKEIAEFLTSDTENVPPNLTRVLVPNLGLEYIPSPNYAVYSNRIHPARYIHVNVDDRIRQLHVEQEAIREREARLEADYIQQKQTLESTTKEISKRSVLIGQHQSRNNRAMQEKIELENFDYPELPEYDRLKMHLSDSGDKIAKCREESKALQQKLEEISDQREQYRLQEADETKALEEINQKLSAVDSEYQEVVSRIRGMDLHFEENTRSLQKTLQVERKMLDAKATLSADVAKLQAEAKLLGEFIATSDTEEGIRESISRYKSKIRQVEQLNYDIEEVQRDLNVLKNDQEQRANQLKVLGSVAFKLGLTYHKRAQVFQKARRHYFTMVQFQFEQALQMRKFKVTFKEDYDEKTWMINVFPPSGNETSNTRSLSGGERSFTTVSLLKGLWSTSDHPFYFLDEYDVFTDEVNRKFITEILITEGMECLNRQFCFLTPQDTKVEANNCITVHKLDTPDR